MACRIAEEVATEKSSMSVSTSSWAASRLNPDAPEWDITKERPSKEKRCLYLTFSNSLPFSESEIADFFNSAFGNYGPCVESVYVIRPRGNRPSMEAKVVFRFLSVAVMVMAGREEVIYVINDKALSCKWFKRREG